MADNDYDEDPWSHDLPEWEIWACARAVEMSHGDRGPRYIAERIGEFAALGDAAGVLTWKRIATAYQAMRSTTIIKLN